MTTLPSTRSGLTTRLTNAAVPLATTAALAAVALWLSSVFSPVEAVVFGAATTLFVAPLVGAAVLAFTHAGLSRRQAWAVVATAVHTIGTAYLTWALLSLFGDTTAETIAITIASSATTPLVLGTTAVAVGGPLVGVLLRDRLFDAETPDQ